LCLGIRFPFSGPPGGRSLPGAAVLTRLVALNHARAAEEKRGLIRYLRPEYQTPTAAAPQPVKTTLVGTDPDSSSSNPKSKINNRQSTPLPLPSGPIVCPSKSPSSASSSPPATGMSPLLTQNPSPSSSAGRTRNAPGRSGGFLRRRWAWGCKEAAHSCGAGGCLVVETCEALSQGGEARHGDANTAFLLLRHRHLDDFAGEGAG
jgi:hypothetical protein